MKYTLIHPDGTRQQTDWIKPTLKELQNAVGGYIERVPLKGNALMYVNEDGMSLNLPFNPHVNHLWPGGVLGVAIVATPKGWKGTL
jgi:hypothetical protein